MNDFLEEMKKIADVHKQRADLKVSLINDSFDMFRRIEKANKVGYSFLTTRRNTIVRNLISRLNSI